MHHSDRVHGARHAGSMTGGVFGNVAHLSRADEAAEIYNMVQRLYVDFRADFRMPIDRRLHGRPDLRIARTAFDSAFSFHCASGKKS
jgi:hypothetical protein